MRSIFVFTFLLLAAGMFSCESEPKTEKPSEEVALMDEELAKAMVGVWESLSVQIEMPSWGGGDSTGYLEAEAHNWTEVMQMQPIRTYFLQDGTYYAEYRNSVGAITGRPSGTWEVEGDTLIYNERYPEPTVFKQQVSRVNDTDFRFSFVSDFDLDGAEDDRGVGISRKLQ